MTGELQVIRLDAADPTVVRLDDGAAPSVVYVPGTDVAGISETELSAALEPYATRTYVDAAVATGGDLSAVQALIDTTVAVHHDSPSPHPAYDSMRSLTLLFENRLV